MGDTGAGGGVGGRAASGAGVGSGAVSASSGGGVGGSGGGTSGPGPGGGLGPFCPVSLAASVRGEGMLSVSELLLTAAVRGREGQGEWCRGAQA